MGYRYLSRVTPLEFERIICVFIYLYCAVMCPTKAFLLKFRKYLIRVLGDHLFCQRRHVDAHVTERSEFHVSSDLSRT